ncbi:hypothetical protein ACLI4Q_14060 [Natrialbaceae archaeon A-CW1-1]
MENHEVLYRLSIIEGESRYDREEFILELVMPFVLESKYPNVYEQDVSWWWKEDHCDLHEREERGCNREECTSSQTLDHR